MLEHLTQCECIEPGYCTRHKCDKDRLRVEMCQRFQHWFELWEQGHGPGQSHPVPDAQRIHIPCRHRGPHTRNQQCPTCQGHVEIKVFECCKHQECVLSTKQPEIVSCQTCTDYIPLSSEHMVSVVSNSIK